MLSNKQKFYKRCFDIIVSFICLIIAIIPIIILVVLASFSTNKFGIFVQKRVGYKGKLFRFYKIRSMKSVGLIPTKNNESYLLEVNHITINGDRRITKLGKFLRRFKLDELPQLVNVLIGNMSFVGPRPDIKGYADELKGEDRIILTVRPGITGPATLKYRNEEMILSKQRNPVKYNKEVIWKDKIKLNKEYINNWSFKADITCMFKTLSYQIF